MQSNLEELDASENYKITTVAPFSGTLRKLCVTGWYCRIDDACLLSATRLEELDASRHPNITSVAPFAATLRKLTAASYCGITDAALDIAVHLEILDGSFNPKNHSMAFRADLILNK